MLHLVRLAALFRRRAAQQPLALHSVRARLRLADAATFLAVAGPTLGVAQIGATRCAKLPSVGTSVMIRALRVFAGSEREAVTYATATMMASINSLCAAQLPATAVTGRNTVVFEFWWAGVHRPYFPCTPSVGVHPTYRCVGR